MYDAGTTGGGVMKTVDGAYTWQPITDKYFGGTIGAIAVYPPNPDIVYVGTGQWTLRGREVGREAANQEVVMGMMTGVGA